MRIYRLQIRIIQLSVILTMIIMVFGLVNVWLANGESVPAGGEDPITGGNQNPTETQVPQTEDPGEKNKPVNTKIVCLGDSYTIGWPGEAKNSWPARLAEILKVEVINAGKTYQNTGDLLERFEQDVVAHQPGRVIIFAGVGDALRDKPFEEFQSNIKALVEKAEANHIIPILAYTIPYPGTEELYKAYREWEEAYALEKKIMVLDFKQVLFDEDGKIIKDYADKNYPNYPNKEGHAAMADYAARVLQ
ncbi:MAG TPA: GDSL family lipase [Peptococcaceae bacterium]|nr:GDSL family lipase [Peptococcaceae bacterium]